MQGERALTLLRSRISFLSLFGLASIFFVFHMESALCKEKTSSKESVRFDSNEQIPFASVYKAPQKFEEKLPLAYERNSFVKKRKALDHFYEGLIGSAIGLTEFGGLTLFHYGIPYGTTGIFWLARVMTVAASASLLSGYVTAYPMPYLPIRSKIVRISLHATVAACVLYLSRAAILTQ